MPHLGEQIFENIDTDELIQFRDVSPTWKFLVENVLLKSWKGKLLEACLYGKTEIVKILLDYGNLADIGLHTKTVIPGFNTGLTPFMMACFVRCKDIVQLLLSHPDTNIDVNDKSDTGITALMLSCMPYSPKEKNVDIVKLLLSFPNIESNARNYQGRTAFNIACYYGFTDAVKIFLSNSTIDFNARTEKGNTAFMTACATGRKDIVELLLDHSADQNIKLNARNDDGLTAFSVACLIGNKDVVKTLLLNSTIDYNNGFMGNWTAFTWACRYGEKDIVELLLEDSNRNSELNTGVSGWVGFAVACNFGHKDVVQLLIANRYRNIESNERKLRLNRFLHRPSHSGEYNPFELACYAGHKDVVKLLLDNSDRVELGGRKAFKTACERGHKEVVELMLDYSIIDTSVYDGMPQEMEDLVELHQEENISFWFAKKFQ